MTLPDFVTSALNAAIDYSTPFTERVAAIARKLSEVLRRPVSHDADMNYRAAQSLSILMEVERPDRRGKAPIEIRVYISSRAPLFAFYCLDPMRAFVEPNQIGNHVSCRRWPGSGRNVFDTIRDVLTAHGYREVSEELFDVQVPGARTELDDLPATVFQALFAELT